MRKEKEREQIMYICIFSLVALVIFLIFLLPSPPSYHLLY